MPLSNGMPMFWECKGKNYFEKLSEKHASNQMVSITYTGLKRKNPALIRGLLIH
jgi:hypothetical protein